MHRPCGNVLGKGCYRHLMKYVGRQKGGEIKENVLVEQGCERSDSEKEECA